VAICYVQCWPVSACGDRLQWVDICPPRRAEIRSSLPVVSTVCADQVECKRLVSTDAIGLSVAMQMSGQVSAITQLI
jgi:hypothetical protein